MRRPGFSYIEMLIVIALIVAMATISLNAFRGARDQANFKKAVNDTVSLIEKARNMALNSQQIDTDAPPDGVADAVTPYGITISSGSIILFGDVDEDYDYSNGSDIVVEEISFDQNVTIDIIDEANDGTAVHPVYTPPLAELTIYNSDHNEYRTDVTITITSDATGLSQDVTLNTVSRVPEVSTVY